MRTFKKGLSTLLKILFVYWLILFLTGKATFIYSSGPQISSGDTHSIITCNYMTWSGLMSRDYWYSEDGTTGIQSCPLLQSVKDLHPKNITEINS